jgi:branched-chain amino acid transport system substrate-binding protein
MRAALIASAVFLSGCGHKGPPDPIVVGQVVPLTGEAGAEGQRARNGVLLAVEEANASESKVRGRPVHVLHADSASGTDNGPQAARLVAINKVSALLGGTGAAETASLAAIAQARGVPLVAAGGMPGLAFHDFVFHLGMKPAEQGQGLARFASTELKAAKVVVVVRGSEASDGTTSSLCSAWASSFASGFRANGGALAGEWTFQKDEELKDLAERLRKNPPAAIFAAGVAKDLLALRKAGLPERVPVLFAGPEASLATLRTNPLPNPVYLATAFAADKLPSELSEFVQRYHKRFDEEPDAIAALAYDGARFLFEGLRRAEAMEGSKIRDALSQVTQWQSLTGPLYLDREHWASRPVFILCLANGTTKVVQRYVPANAAQGASALAVPGAARYAAWK